jgi:adhesin transport system outer membrane protein
MKSTLFTCNFDMLRLSNNEMKTFGRSFGLLVLLLALFPVQATAVQIAEYLPDLLASHERLQAARERRESALFRVREARGGWFPSLSVNSEVGHEQIDREGPVTDLGRNTQRFRASQLLWDFGLTHGRVDRAKALFALSQSDTDFVRQGLILEAARAYLDLIRFQKIVGFSVMSEQSIKRQTGIEETLVERGAGLSSDVLQAKSQLAAARALRVVAEGDFINAGNRFKAVFGFMVDNATIEHFVEPIIRYEELPVTAEEAVGIALEENKQLSIAAKNVEAAEAEVTIAKSSFFPSLNAFGEYERLDNDGGVKGVRFENRVGAELSYAIFNGGADTAAFRASKKTREEAANLVLDLGRSIEEQVRVSLRNLVTAQRRAEWFRNQAQIEGEFLELARKERKLGNRSLIDVLNAEVNFVNARSGAVSAEIDQKIAVYDLLFAMGRLSLETFLEP